MGKIDYSVIFNSFCDLYYKTKSPDIEKKAMGKICEIIYKTMPIVYYSYVKNKKIFRRDNDDKISDCCIRICERIKRWKVKNKGAYSVESLTAMEYLEIVYALHNEKQQFIDNIESLDLYNDKQREMEDNDDTEIDAD